MLLASFCSYVSADDLVTYVPDVDYTSLASVGDNSFAIVDETKAIYGSGAQNLGYDTFQKAFVSTNAGYLWKLELISNESNADVNGKYLLRLYTPAGAAYNIWGSPGYLNSQPATGSCSFILGLNNQYGQDGKNLAAWDIEYVEGEGFALKNVGTGLYLNGNGPAKSTEAYYWRFCSLKEDLIENPIAKPTRTATDAKEDVFQNIVAIGAGAAYDAETKTMTGNCGCQWAEGVDLSSISIS